MFCLLSNNSTDRKTVAKPSVTRQPKRESPEPPHSPKRQGNLLSEFGTSLPTNMGYDQASGR
ncbi:hypothetical protein EJ06DRAFT_530163, partial [Trichodelitschia bisporula]